MKSHESYIAVINRLKEYRKRCRLSQKEMGNMLGVTQSHYYKLENGLKTISRNSLLNFQEAGQDIFWLFTGRKKKNSDLDRYIFSCNTNEGKQQMLEALLWIVEEGLRIKGLKQEESLMKARKLMKIGGLYEKLIWEKIRTVECMTQNQMADMLEINIKRYRDIEKEEIEEDAEILSALYENLKYSPMLFLNRERFCLDELNIVWETFDEPLQKRLFMLLDDCLALVNCDGL